MFSVSTSSLAYFKFLLAKERKLIVLSCYIGWELTTSSLLETKGLVLVTLRSVLTNWEGGGDA